MSAETARSRKPSLSEFALRACDQIRVISAKIPSNSISLYWMPGRILAPKRLETTAPLEVLLSDRSSTSRIVVDPLVLTCPHAAIIHEMKFNSRATASLESD